MSKTNWNPELNAEENYEFGRQEGLRESRFENHKKGFDMGKQEAQKSELKWLEMFDDIIADATCIECDNAIIPVLNRRKAMLKKEQSK